ncbi:unnamed protein product [Rotaria sordida]|uniref:Uncharacterized protein n=1 Tax=Rotaria sordida TaxID=392033 RepID=A0A819VG46_9BILA|nr:unnamed protein product [Rotaria sordida]
MTTQDISPSSSTYKIHHQPITLCIIGSACSNKRILSSVEDRYVYEYINDERQVICTLVETKILLSQRQLRIYIVDSFDVDISVPRRNRPLYCQHLSSAVICFVGIRRDTHANRL